MKPAAGNLETLVLSAFAAARASGKPGWFRMRTAVLKNRLLDLTDRAFREGDYGIASVRELPDLLPDLLQLDTTGPQLIIELRVQARDRIPTPAAGPATPSSRRIRRDLWNAMFDFGSGKGWIWDPATSSAVAVDLSSNPPDEPLLPTLTRGEVVVWRSEFLKAHEHGIEPDELARLQSAWAEAVGSSSALPKALRSSYFRFLTDQITDRLVSWFKDAGISSPPIFDLVQPPEVDEVDELRRRIIECLHEMNGEELRALLLPARVLMRRR